MSKSKYLLRILPIILFLFTACSGTTETVKHHEKRAELSGTTYGVNLDTVRALRFDTGKMWTFDFPPYEYLDETYSFKPSEEWMNDVMMSAVRFGSWCSGSFISEDGLIMTNNHCSDFLMSALNKEGEDLRTTGFIANTLEEERRHPTLFVDVLVKIEDVSSEVHAAIAGGANAEEKAARRKEVIEKIEKKNSGDGLTHRVVALYSGGKYSLYSYRRYTDIRLVLIPESELGLYGGDPDNYTYPRYSLDVTFWRAYDENGNPAKIEKYYRWSREGAQENEPIFVIGNPGQTNRSKTMAQLEYMRDYQMYYNSYIYTELQKIYEEMIAEYPERRQELVDALSNNANVAKRFSGVLRGLRNPIYMKRKEDFERNFRNSIMNDSNLKNKYGNFWEGIETTRGEMRGIANEYYGYLRINPVTNNYVRVATRLVELAESLRRPESERGDSLADIGGYIEKVYPKNFDKALTDKRVRLQVELMHMALGVENPLVQRTTGGRRGAEGATYMISRSNLHSVEDVKRLAERGAEAIMNSEDPFIIFVRETKDRYNDVVKRAQEITITESGFEEQLGQALFDVYGTTIPPDGTGTLRIGDGILKRYEYNGTIAPLFTTYYGLYDRYYSHQKQFPWSLPERWVNPPAEFDLSTYYNFISTNDIVGGSSGSAVINKNKEVVGLAFDGNIESNSGYFIYDTVENRMVSVASQGILEAVRDMYRLTRLAEEIEMGRISK
jgi:hypothetical protein